MKIKKVLLTTSLLTISLITLSGCSFHLFTNKNSGPTIKRTLSSKKFNSLKVASDITDVELHASNQYKVIYHGLKRFKPSVNVKNGQLKITQTSNGVSYNIKEGNTVAIYLPAKELQNININLSDGDIDADGKVQAKNVKLHSDDGDVNFDDLRISSGKITSDDGDISVSNLLTRKGATVESDDGDIRIRKSNASGYRLTSDDGDVTFKGDTSDNDDGGSYYKNTKSSNLLSTHSDDGDVNVN